MTHSRALEESAGTNTLLPSGFLQKQKIGLVEEMLKRVRNAGKVDLSTKRNNHRFYEIINQNITTRMRHKEQGLV